MIGSGLKMDRSGSIACLSLQLMIVIIVVTMRLQYLSVGCGI